MLFLNQVYFLGQEERNAFENCDSSYYEMLVSGVVWVARFVKI